MVKKSIGFRVPEELHRKLETHCQRHGISITDALIIAVYAYLEEERPISSLDLASQLIEENSKAIKEMRINQALMSANLAETKNGKKIKPILDEIAQNFLILTDDYD